MAHVMGWACAFCGGLLLASASAAAGATKTDEGFASQHERYGRFSRPTNRIEQGTMGKDAYHWIQWRDQPVGRHTIRCKVTYQGRDMPIVDEEITYEESASAGYSLCGFSPRSGRDPEGLYTFTQHLNGAQVGEAALRIEMPFFEGLRIFPWKIALILFSVVVFALAWLGKKKVPRSIAA